MGTSKGAKLVETAKSIILVVLFLFTILLLYFFWGSTPIKDLIRENPPQYGAVDPAAVMRPDFTSICFGGNSYTVAADKFDMVMDCFREFSASRNLSIEEIAKERYDEVERSPSIKAVFGYFAPFGAFCEIHGIDRIPGVDSVETLSELVYAADYDDRLYAADAKAKKYYRVTGSSNSCFDLLKDEIGSAEKSSTAYFTLTTYMGGEIDNDALCPVSFESGIRDVHYYPDDFSKQGDKPRNMIRSFFSDNFDFVKRIEEKNGTVIYMYGYGRTVVIAHNNGVLEFKREDDERAGSQARYADALEKASSFIAAHGAFESIDGINLTPYIKEVVPDPEGKKGFRFVFGVEINGSRVYYQSGEPVIIDVTGGRVSYYKRDLVNVFSNELGAAGGDYREAFSAINLLAGNLEYVKGALEETKQAGAGEISSIEGLVERVSRFDCGYLRSAENTGSLEAAWVVTIGGLEFYFGLDDGKPLGYRPIFVAGDSPR